MPSQDLNFQRKMHAWSLENRLFYKDAPRCVPQWKGRKRMCFVDSPGFRREAAVHSSSCARASCKGASWQEWLKTAREENAYCDQPPSITDPLGFLIRHSKILLKYWPDFWNSDPWFQSFYMMLSVCKKKKMPRAGRIIFPRKEHNWLPHAKWLAPKTYIYI